MNKKVYLSQFYSEVPANCVFNKVATDCGGTSLEIENMKRDSIITVPLEQMIDNKVDAYPNQRTPNDFKMFGVKEGIYKEDIVEYLKANKVHKIITTFDSLYKVIDAINELKQRDIKNYFLLVDEVHYILNNYLLRKKAIKPLLKQYTLFDKWCFMSATPNEDEFTLDELRGIPVIVAPLTMEHVHIENVRTPQVEATTKKLIEDYLTSRLQNAHIFVNSTEIIASLIKACNLTNDNCKAVWSKGNKNYKRTIAGITRSKVGDKAKKINFYTSCSFEGCDVYDTEGQYIIVSDGNKAHTLNDISTSFRQILGRLRNTKYRNSAIHIFKSTRFSEYASFTDYKEYTRKLESDSLKLIDVYNQCEARTFDEDVLNDQYITKDEGVYKLDRNLITYDLRKYKSANETYSTIAILEDEQNTAGFTTSLVYDIVTPSDLLNRNKEVKISFKDAFIEYSELMNHLYEFDNTNQLRIALLNEAYEFMYKAYSLGVDVVKDLKYNQTNIKKLLIANSDKSHENKIARLLSSDGITRNEWISLTDVKDKLNHVYELLSIKKTAKATDLEKYFMVQPASRRVGNEKELKRGYLIIRDKFIFN